MVLPTGATQPIPAGSLNLPSMSVAAADPQQGAAVSFATYVESGTAPVGAGTFKELPGTVTGWASDDHVPSPNVWLNTDVKTPVAFPGGAVVDSSGAVVAYATWLADNPSEHVYGPTASLIAPVLAAAKAGTPYKSPFIVAGSGQEQAAVTGWGTGRRPVHDVATVDRVSRRRGPDRGRLQLLGLHRRRGLVPPLVRSRPAAADRLWLEPVVGRTSRATAAGCR